MKTRSSEYKHFLFIGITLIALGINFSTTLQNSFGSLGTVFIAIGGLFFIIAMNKKREMQSINKENPEDYT